MTARTGLPGTSLILLTTAACLFYAIFIGRSAVHADGRLAFALFDDAMVSMRYARNLAEGLGLVWNPGERVEGYTNLLWTLWMAVIHVTGVTDERASLVVMLSGVPLILATAAVAARIASRLFRSSQVTVATFALVAFNYALVFWTLRGMEVGLLALLMTLTLGLVLRLEARAKSQHSIHRTVLCLCLTLALAVTARRDAFILPVILLPYVAWAMRGRERTIALSAITITLVVTLGGQMGFSAWYYGDPWPNTYYLKLEGVTLIERLRRGVPALAIVMVRNLLPLLIAASFVRHYRPWTAVRGPVALFSAAIAAQAAYSVYVGGDAWEYMGYTNRYVTPVVPVLSILAAAGIHESVATVERRTHLVSLLLATTGVRLVLDAVMHVMNRGVVLTGFTWFEVHRALWLTVVLSMAVAAFLLAAAVKSWSRGAGQRRVKSRAARMSRFAVAALGVWALVNGVAFIEWGTEEAWGMTSDLRSARLGLILGHVTSPEAVIAVTSAGNVPYFSRRRAIDILGKTDPAIAHMAPVSTFLPGHNKWNLDHSIRDGGPDVVLGLPRRPGDADYLVRLGYRPYPGTCFVKGDTVRVDHATLWRELIRVYPNAPPLQVPPTKGASIWGSITADRQAARRGRAQQPESASALAGFNDPLPRVALGAAEIR